MSTEPKAKRPKWHYIAGAVGALVLCGVVGNMLPDTDTDTPTTTSAPASGDSDDEPAAKPAEPTAAPKLAGIGEQVTAGDLAWVVTAVEDKGQSWQGQFDSKTTAGKFLKVDFGILNNGNEEVMILSQPVIKDSRGREFKAYDNVIGIIDSEQWCTVKSLPAGVPQTCTNAYELPADATGLTIVVDDGGLVSSDKATIDLGQ